MNSKAKAFKKDLLLKYIAESKEFAIDPWMDRWNVTESDINYIVEERENAILNIIENKITGERFTWIFSYDMPYAFNDNNDSHDYYEDSNIFINLIEQYNTSVKAWYKCLKEFDKKDSFYYYKTLRNGAHDTNVEIYNSKLDKMRYSLAVDFDKHKYEYLKFNLKTGQTELAIICHDPIDFFYTIQENGIAWFEDVVNITPKELIGETWTDKVVKDFVYKVDDSKKLKVINEANSIDDFFKSDISDNDVMNKLVIMAIDTKMPLITIKKEKQDGDIIYRFIIDITTEKGDKFAVSTIIAFRQQLRTLIQSTITSLRSYKQFSKYADDLEECIK